MLCLQRHLFSINIASKFHFIRSNCFSHSKLTTTRVIMENEGLAEENLERPYRLSKQEKKNARYDRRKEKLKDKKRVAKVRLNEKLQSVCHEEKLAFSANKKLQKQRGTDNAIKAMDSDVRICIDLSFNEVNSPREQRSLIKQCTLSYAAIRKSAFGVALHISSLHGDVGVSLCEQGAEHWHVRKHSSSVYDVFDRENIVVLSPDADDVLQEFDPTKIYVVGGIIDRTVKNNLTLDRASERGVSAARLPVKEFFPQAQSHVINIDQVVALCCHYSETKDWKISMERSIPIRRQTHNKPRKVMGDSVATKTPLT